MQTMKGIGVVLASVIVAALLIMVALHLIGVDPLYKYEASLGLVKSKASIVSQTSTRQSQIVDLEKKNTALANQTAGYQTTISNLQTKLQAAESQVSQLQKQIKKLQTTQAKQSAEWKKEASLLTQLQPDQAVTVLNAINSIPTEAEILAQMSTSDAAPILAAFASQDAKTASQLFTLSTSDAAAGQ